MEYLILLVLMTTILYTSKAQFNIGIIYDQTTVTSLPDDISEVTDLTGLIDGVQVNISRVAIDVTGITSFQLYNEVCRSVSNDGILGFVLACDCHHLGFITSILKNLDIPVIVVSAGCDNLQNNDSKSEIAALTEVISSLYWEDALLIYDDKNVHQLDRINDALAQSNTTVQTLKVIENNIYNNISFILDYVQNSLEMTTNFIVMCSDTCVTTILDMANSHDIAGYNQRLFTYLAKWLIVSETNQLGFIEHLARDIDNLAVVVPVQNNVGISQRMQRATNNLIQSVENILSMNLTTQDWQYTETECGHKIAATQFIKAQIQNATIYEIYSCMYKPGGLRRFELIGISQQQAFRLYTAVFPNVMYGLNDRELRVATLLWEPFTMYSNSSDSMELVGLCIQMLEQLSQNLNFTYSIHFPQDGLSGDYVEGTWRGIVGQLVRKEVDLAVAPLSSTIERSMVVDFSDYYFLESGTALLKYVHPEKKKWRLFIEPYRMTTWMCFLASIPLGSLIIWAVSKYSPYYFKRGVSPLAKLDNCIIYIYGSFLAQGGVHLPDAQSGRLFIGFWWMYCIVVMATYSGNLIAFLTVTKSELPFQTLDEIAKQDSHRIGVLGGSAIEASLKRAQGGDKKIVWDKITSSALFDDDILSSDSRVHLKKVLSDNYIYLADKTGFEVVKNNRCDVDIIKDELVAMPYSIALPNNSAYLQTFNEEVQKMKESGLMNKWKAKWWPKMNFCGATGTTTNAKAVSLSDMQGAYYILMLFLVVSAIALLVEYIIKRLKVSQRKPQPSVRVNMGWVGTVSDGRLTAGSSTDALVNPRRPSSDLSLLDLDGTFRGSNDDVGRRVSYCDAMGRRVSYADAVSRRVSYGDVSSLVSPRDVNVNDCTNSNSNSN